MFLDLCRTMAVRLQFELQVGRLPGADLVAPRMEVTHSTKTLLFWHGPHSTKTFIFFDMGRAKRGRSAIQKDRLGF